MGTAQPGGAVPNSAQQFADQRQFLNALAYRMLGSVTEAEDVVQDAWLRWNARTGAEVTHPRAYLMQVATRLIVDRLASARARREIYVGSWLPDPVVTSPDVADEVAEADSVSMAMMVVLQTLSPLERLVFVLREAFGFQYTEIAEAIGRTDAAVRQIARRAREHVRERHQRFEPRPAEHRRVCERFLAACEGGDFQALTAVLAPEVSLVTDSGGEIRAPRRPVVGADKVARFLLPVFPRQFADARLRQTVLNGDPGLIAFRGDTAIAAVAFELAGDRITRIYAIVNPAKLAHLPGPSDVTFAGPAPV